LTSPTCPTDTHHPGLWRTMRRRYKNENEERGKRNYDVESKGNAEQTPHQEDLDPRQQGASLEVELRGDNDATEATRTFEY